MKSRPEKAFSGVCDISALVLHPDPVDLSGGFADVYKANHPELGFLALKRPRGACQPGSIGYRHLEKEGAIWKNLEHPNVLKFLGIHRDSQTIYLVSPYMENGTVVQYLRTHPDADHFRARFVLDLARGLSYLHSNGIVHGDIKGSNMLVSSAIEGVVADFGLAKVVDTRTGTSQRGVGSTRWQSPEMLLHGESRTFKSDVYAFGMTTYEIITGSIPFGPEFPDYAIVSRISNKDRPLPLPRLSSHGYAYTNEWTVAQAAWHEEPPRRPDMNRVIMVLQAPQEHKLRIRVECDTALKGSGYISRELDGPSGSQVVTQNVDKALVVVWDCDSPELSAFSMINNTQNQRWFALRFSQPSPNLRQDPTLWATFTAAGKIEDHFSTVPTSCNSGLYSLLTWVCKGDGVLIPQALGETLEAGLRLSISPPHIFFCYRMKDHWDKVKYRASIVSGNETELYFVVRTQSAYAHSGSDAQ